MSRWSRLRTDETDHAPPRGASQHAGVNSAAICRRLMPRPFSSRAIGNTRAARSPALAFAVAVAAAWNAPGAVRGSPPSLSPASRQVACRAPGSVQHVFGALADLRRLMLGDRGQDVQREPCCVRVIDRYELHVVAVHKLREERYIPAQPVQLGDDEDCPGQPALLQRGLQLRPVAQLAAFDLGVLTDQFPAAAVEIGPHSLLLRLEAETGASLLCCAYPVAGDEVPEAIALFQSLQRPCRNQHTPHKPKTAPPYPAGGPLGFPYARAARV